MALTFADRTYETSTTTGNGTLALGGTAAANFRTFTAAVGEGNTCYYAAIHRTLNEWEVGIGTVTGTTLERTTVLMTSAGNTTKIVFSAGTKDVFNDLPAERLVALSAAGTLQPSIVTSSLTTVGALAAGSLAAGFGSISIGASSVTAGAASFTTGAFSGQITQSVTSNASAVALQATNLSNGTAARMAIQLTNDAGAVGLLAQYGSGFTTSAFQVADSVLLYANGTGGIHISAGGVAGLIKLYTGSNALALTLSATQAATFSGNLTVGASKFVVTAATGAVAMSGILAVGTTYKWYTSETASLSWLTTGATGSESGIAASATHSYFRTASITVAESTATQFTINVPLAITGALTGVTTLAASGNVTQTHGTEAAFIVVKSGASANSTKFYNAGSAIGLWDTTNARSIFQYDPAANDFYIAGARTLLSGSLAITGALSGVTSATLSADIQFTGAGATHYAAYTTENDTGTGSVILQAGGGSALYGGSISLFASAHASKPGYVDIGLGSSDAARTFRVMSSGLSSGSVLLSVASTGAATFAGQVTMSTIGAFAGGDKYLVVDASGNIHKSAIGPAS